MEKAESRVRFEKATSEKANGDATGGAATDRYAQYVRNLFAPSTKNRMIGSLLSQFYDDEYGPAISATAQLKADLLLDKGNANELYMPVDLSCSLADQITRTDQITSADFHVYQPFASRSKTKNGNETSYQKSSSSTYRDHSSSDEYPNTLPEKRWSNDFGETRRRNPILLDYRSFARQPLSPYLYLNYNNVGKGDTRIVGSEFVMLNLRKNDDFLAKIDDTLMRAREVNSWS